MNREQAEKLLAALIFDDLDETSKADLLAYLQTDDELRERLADMRMAAKVASDTLQRGPDPVLGKRRLKSLARLAGRRSPGPTIFTARNLAAAAAVLAVVALPVLFILPGLNRVRSYPGRMGSASKGTSEYMPKYADRSPEVSSQPIQLSSEDISYAYDPKVQTQRYTRWHSTDDAAILTDAAILPEGDISAMGEADRFAGNLHFSIPAGDPSASHYWLISAGYDAPFDEAPGSELSSATGISGRSVTMGGGMGGYGGGGYGGGGYGGGGYGGYGGISEGAATRGGGDIRGSNIYASHGGKTGSVTRGPGGVGGDGVGGGTFSFSGPTELVAGSDVSKDFGTTISGNTISNSTISNNIMTDGQNVTFIDGHLDMAVIPEGFTIATGPGSVPPAIPGGDNIYAVWNGKAGGASGPADRPDSTLQPQGGPEGVAAADSGETKLDLNSFQGRDTLAKDYGYAETWNWEVDRGAETWNRDGENAESPFAVSGTIKQHGRRDDFYREEADSSLKVIEKHDTTSTEYGGRPVLIVDEPGLLRGEEFGVEHDYSPDVTKPVDREINGREPILGDVPASGRLYDRKGGKSALSEEQAQRTAKSPDGARSWFGEEAERTESESYIPASPSLGLMKQEGGRDAYWKKAKESSAEAKKLLPKLNMTIGAGTTEATGEPMPSTREVKLERWNVADGDAIVIDRGSYNGNINLVDEEIRLFISSDPDGSKTEAQAVTDSKSTPHKLSSRSDLNGPISQPEGKPAETEYEIINLRHAEPQEVKDTVAGLFKDLPETQSSPGVSIEATRKKGQIIVSGSKDMRDKVKNVVERIDKRRPQVLIDVSPVITTVLSGEDETDLPEASRFKLVPVNPWVMAGRDALSTFALDVDTASYTLCRRYIRGGFQPPPGAVRMEEFVNYFNYQYPQRANPTFKVHAQAARSPFAGKGKDLTLLKIGVKARTIGRDQRKAAHLILVVDASASMGQPDRLGLVQKALGLLVDKLSAADRVSLITCADQARLHMEPTSARQREKIHEAIDAIQPSGSTNLLAGLKLGYATARRAFAPKQINHVILCSDGVANVGQTEAEAVLKAVAAERKQGITITCVGVGYGSYNDAFLEGLANRGDGSYVFLDSAGQAQRVFVEQLAATLQTVAKDARIQVDFNPDRVRRYRLIGYENRDIEDKRFRDDTIDAGEVGSGQCSTALYELELIGTPSADRQDDLGTVFVRYRHADTGQIEEISSRLESSIVRRRTVESAPRFYLAACAARFAEILRQSEHAQGGNLADVLRVAEQVNQVLPLDRDVRELAELIRKAEHLPASP